MRSGKRKKFHKGELNKKDKEISRKKTTLGEAERQKDILTTVEKRYNILNSRRHLDAGGS